MTASSSTAVGKCLEQPLVAASPNLFASPRRRTLVLSLLLTVAVLVAYQPITRNAFLGYDDDGYITDNAHVKSGLTWATVKWAFSSYDKANYHPVTWLSHALDCSVFGLNPAGHHYENVLLHALNAVLLFLLLQRATGFAGRSLMVAALFALHPVNVESVAWASERKNVLSMMFFLLALYAYGEYARKPGLRRYGAVFFLFALGLLAKPQVITFPFLVCLWDYWPLGRIGGPSCAGSKDDGGNMPRFSIAWLALEKLPLLALAAASAVVTMQAQKSGGAVKSLSQYSPLLRVETALISYVRYLGHAFWPAKLVVLYPHPLALYPAWQVAAAVLLLLLVTVSVLLARAQKYLAVGWFWFLGSLVPMIGLVQVGAQAMADRYAYIPFVGLFVMIVWLAADVAKARKLPRPWLAIPAVAALLLLGALTYRQQRYWHDDFAIWQHTLALTEDNYVAHDQLGIYLLNQGQPGKAAVEFRAALAIKPDDLPANMHLGPYELGSGQPAAAISRFQLIAASPKLDAKERAVADYDTGIAYRQMGEPAKAKQYFETALQLEPDEPMTLIELGLIAEQTAVEQKTAQHNADLSEAIALYTRSLKAQPSDVGCLLLAQALRQQGRPKEADAILRQLALLSPDLSATERTVNALRAGK